MNLYTPVYVRLKYLSEFFSCQVYYSFIMPKLMCINQRGSWEKLVLYEAKGDTEAEQ